MRLLLLAVLAVPVVAAGCGESPVGVDASAVSPADGSASATDSGPADASLPPPDSGEAGGPDAASEAADGGGDPGDAAAAAPDAETAPPADAAAPMPDAGAIAADAATPPPDAGNPNACAPQFAGCSTYQDATAEAANRTISFPSLQYSPKCLEIAAGQSVTFSGSFSFHPLKQACGPADAIAPTSSGSSKTFVLSAPGEYGYYCTAHGTASGSGMAGSILVR